MNLIRYEPWTAARRLQREFDHLLRPFPGATDGPEHWVPAIDIVELNDRFELSADLPGVAPEHLEVTTEDDRLVVRGERRRPEYEGELGLQRYERTLGKFERRFELPETADAEAITASSNHGVLTVTVPKKARLQPRQIKIDVSQ